MKILNSIVLNVFLWRVLNMMVDFDYWIDKNNAKLSGYVVLVVVAVVAAAFLL